MRIYEFHFNPGEKDDLVFESFCYEPENIYERRLGSLFMIGSLAHTLPQNAKLLDKISSTIKKEYYYKFQRTNEIALKEALKSGNGLLSGEVSKNNTTWLGNLNFAIVSLKNYDLNFTKVGGIKLLLLRGPHVIDIGSKLDNQEIEPYPLKIFNNIVSGKLDENDIILAITPEVLPIFKGLVDEIARISPFDEKKFSELIKSREEKYSHLSGSCLLVVVSKETAGKKPKIVFQKEQEVFSFKKMLSPAVSGIGTIKGKFKDILNFPSRLKSKLSAKPKTKVKKEKVKQRIQKTDRQPALKFNAPKPKLNFSLPKFRLALPRPKISLSLPRPRLSLPRLSFKIPRPEIITKRKGAKLVILLLTLLALGFFIFRQDEQNKLQGYRETLKIAQEKIEQAENFLILKDVSPNAKNQANNLLLEAWDSVLPLTNLADPIKSESMPVKDAIENKLEELNSLIKINPKLVFEFHSGEFIPQRMISDGTNFYFFSPYAQNIFRVDSMDQGQLIENSNKFNSGTLLSPNSLLLFAKPDKVIPLQNGQLSQEIILKDPYPTYNFTDVAAFRDGVYFLDSEADEVIRYFSLPGGAQNPQLWLYQNTEKPSGGKSIAIDGSIWILDDKNQIFHYAFGRLQEKISVSAFPAPNSFSKIIASPELPYLYISEPFQKRILILDKSGSLIKQYQSQAFDNMLDFAVSADGKTILVLNGLNLYKFGI